MKIGTRIGNAIVAGTYHTYPMEPQKPAARRIKIIKGERERERSRGERFDEIIDIHKFV